MTSILIEDPKFLNSRKINWDLLAPSLQARFNEIQSKIDQNSNTIAKNKANIEINWEHTQKNTEDIKTLRKYIDDSIAKVEQSLLQFLHLPPGAGSGINYSYDHGQYGQLLKLDKKYQRIFPDDDFILCIPTTTEGLNRIRPNISPYAETGAGMVYNVETQEIYLFNTTTQCWENRGWNYDGVAVNLSRTFAYDWITGRFYFFYNPTKFVRII